MWRRRMDRLIPVTSSKFWTFSKYRELANQIAFSLYVFFSAYFTVVFGTSVLCYVQFFQSHDNVLDVELMRYLSWCKSRHMICLTEVGLSTVESSLGFKLNEMIQRLRLFIISSMLLNQFYNALWFPFCVTSLRRHQIVCCCGMVRDWVTGRVSYHKVCTCHFSMFVAWIMQVRGSLGLLLNNLNVCRAFSFSLQNIHFIEAIYKHCCAFAGLRIAPPEAPVTGYMFGKGVYFADMVSKSANYCCTSPSDPVGVLLLSEVPPES